MKYQAGARWQPPRQRTGAGRAERALRPHRGPFAADGRPARLSTLNCGEHDMSEHSPAPEQVTVLAQFIAKPGREGAARDALLRMVEPARAAPGNVGHDVHVLTNNAAAFYLLQSWTDAAALDAYEADPRIRGVLTERLAPDLVASPTRSRARMLSTPDPRRERLRPVAGSPDQLTLMPFFTIRAGEVEAVGQSHLSMVEPTRAEPGCIDYDLYQSLDDPTVMFFYENWTDAEALVRHMNTPNFYRFVRGEVDGRLVVPSTALTLTMISEPGSRRGAD